MDLLFYGSKMPLGPIEDWVRNQVLERKDRNK